jgi:oligoendopeptidase F
VERFYRYYKSKTRKLKVLKVVKHWDKRQPVLEVQIEKVPTKAGM